MTLEELGYKLTEKEGKYYYTGNINLEKTGITSLPDNLVVRGIIFFRNTKITKEEINKVNHNVPKVLFWRDKEYVNVVGQFYKVLSNKRCVYEISWIGDDRIKFLITSGGSNYMTGDNLEETKMKYNYFLFGNS